MTMIISTELKPVILMPRSLFETMMLSVTTAIDKAKDRAILSRTFICLKKTSVQIKPGMNNTRMKPRIPLSRGCDVIKPQKLSIDCAYFIPCIDCPKLMRVLIFISYMIMDSNDNFKRLTVPHA